MLGGNLGSLLNGDVSVMFSALQLSKCPKGLHKKNNNSVESFSTKQEKF